MNEQNTFLKNSTLSSPPPSAFKSLSQSQNAFETSAASNKFDLSLLRNASITKIKIPLVQRPKDPLAPNVTSNNVESDLTELSWLTKNVLNPPSVTICTLKPRNKIERQQLVKKQPNLAFSDNLSSSSTSSICSSHSFSSHSYSNQNSPNSSSSSSPSSASLSPASSPQPYIQSFPSPTSMNDSSGAKNFKPKVKSANNPHLGMYKQFFLLNLVMREKKKL